jgi:ATP-dependent helicase HrpA
MTRPAAGGNAPSAALRPIHLDPLLPIAAHREEIAAALARHPVVIVCGATGSGKSTQLPKLCLEAGRGTAGMIGHTQPRRMAARALASRLAAELGSRVGGTVGFQVRFEDRSGPDCRIKVMTDGILLRELARDPELRRYDTLILDEVHERSLNIDLLLGVVKRLVPRRPELRVLITSATLDPDKLARFFDDAPVIEVSGRSFPVEVRYRPLTGEDEDAVELSLPEGIVAAVRELAERPPSVRADVLVFLPGEKHIREAAEALRSAQLADTELLPLYARLSASEQARLFEPHARRRIVLATNVAETSLTVPGIAAVIDSGLARISRYSVRAKVQRLAVERISRASADQRKGRCGRLAPGICIRLYSEEDFEQREAFTAPEILRTHLAGVILNMAASGLGDPEQFPFLDPPDTRLVNDGLRMLQELGAMTEDRRITPTGRQLAALPCDPRLGRMLVAAAERRALAEVLVIAAFLAVQDPRERPSGAEPQADERHLALADGRSDFITVLNIWRAYDARAAALSRSELRKWCREQFLSFVRMREWQELHAQLEDAVHDIGLARRAGLARRHLDTARLRQVSRSSHARRRAARYSDIHRAILAGFLGSIGNLRDRREYQGARGTRFVIAPGSPLAAKPPKWIVAASLTETARLYARMVAAVEPGWIEAAAAHLVRRTYSAPHWAENTVIAYESVSLYGLMLVSERRIDYGPISPDEAHEVFVREGLVEGGARIEAHFLEANRRLRLRLERLEAKLRRRDIVAGEEAEVRFYRERIPRQVSSIVAFERWLLDAERLHPGALEMSAAQLLLREAPEADLARFPDALALGGNRLPLQYVFEPGAANDGITLDVPAPVVHELEAGRLAWLVPGLRAEKVAALLRALPKAVRKQLVPVPDHARRALEELASDEAAGEEASSSLPRADFFEWMARWITRRAGTPVGAAELAALALPEHLQINIRVLAVPAHGAPAPKSEHAAQPRVARVADALPILAEGRDLAAIRATLERRSVQPPFLQQESANQTVRQRAGPAGVHATAGARGAAGARLHRRWDFGDLPVELPVAHGGMEFRVFPAVEDHGAGVARVEASSAAEAEALIRGAVVRLAELALPHEAKELRRRLAADRELVLLVQGLELDRPLPDAVAYRAFAECFVPGDALPPRSAAEFERLLAARRALLAQTSDRVIDELRSTLRAWRQVRTAREQARGFESAVADVDGQLALLLPPNFIATTPDPWLAQLPRYLKAIARRLERLPGQERRDTELARRIAPFAAAWRKLATAAQRAPPAAQRFRWMLEEFRVSLFAQELGTRMPVSEKRLAAELSQLR